MFELTLKEKENKLNNLILCERIDIPILNKLIDSDLLMTTEWKNDIFNNEREQLRAYKKLINSNGYAIVTYKKVKNMPFGRCNPDKGLGLFNIRRQIRHTLAKKSYIDIDIENCHPNILLQICKKNNIDCDNLNEYVVNRNNILKKVMTEYNVSRDEAKKLFIQILYFGSFKSWATNLKLENTKPLKVIQDFKNEIQNIGNAIYSKNEDIIKLVKKRKEEQKKDNYNNVGAVLSYYLQEIESRVLEQLYIYCEDNQYIINHNAVLCADGLMIEKNKYKEELLSIFNELIKNKFDLNLQFTTKEMNEDYLDILDEHVVYAEETTQEELKKQIELKKKEILEDNNNDKYNEYKKKLEKQLFMIESPLTYCWINERDELTMKAKKDIKDLLKPYKIGKKEFFDLWLEDPTRRSYLKFDFLVNKIDPKIYNTFTGFKYDNNKPINNEIIEPFFNLINTLLNNEKASIDAFLDWIAWIRQRPEMKTEKAVVLYSEVQGVGKNTIMQFIFKIIQYSTSVNKIEQLVDRFNSQLTNKLIILGDEVTVKAKSIRDDLKNMITRTKMIVEKKGIDSYEMSDYSNYIFTTNNQDSFYIEPSDRRFILLELQNKKMSPEDAKMYYKILEDDNVLQSLDTYFKTRLLPERLEVLNNEYKKLLISQSLPAYIQMIYRNYQQYAQDDDFKKNKTYKVSELFTDAQYYAKQNYMTFTFTPSKMAKDFAKEFNIFKGIKDNSNYYEFPKVEIFKEQLKKLRPELIID